MTISTALRKPPVILAAGTVLVALAIFFRIHALYPTVFSDEWTYSRMSRLEPLSQAEIPSFLYLSTYRLTNLCGDGFLSCARLLNVVFFFSAAAFIYLIAKRAMAPGLAVWISLLVVIGPINSYTAYFMPEAMFFFAFWLFTWSLLRLNPADRIAEFLIPAILFGLMALVKPHPIFMYPALIVYLGYLSKRSAYAAWLGAWAMRSVVFVGASVLTKLLVGYAFAGKVGLTLFGGRYEALAERMDGGTERYFAIASNAIGSLSGHLMILAVLLGTGICALLYAAATAFFPKDDGGEPQKIAIFSFLVIGSMVGLAAIFTAAVMGLAPAESLARVHMRYYNFALPLLLILAGAGIGDNPRRRPYLVAAIALAIAALTAYAIGTRIPGFTPSWIDAPEATAASDLPAKFYLVAAFGLLTTVAWAIDQRLGSRIFLFAFAPAMIVLNLYAVNQLARSFEQPDTADRAGIVARQLFERSELRNITVYGLNYGYISKILFHIDSPLTEYVESDRATLPNLEGIRNTNKIAVVLGPTLAVPAGTTEIQGDGFSIIRSIPPDFYVDFTRKMPSGAISDTIGLSLPESWGAWSDGGLVTLKFRKNLPERLRVYLRAKAFGPNIGKTFAMGVGGQTKDFSLTGSPADVELAFDNPDMSDTVTISVPQPTSPSETGAGGDPRKLGIAMIEFRIGKLGDSGK